jgi:hypothetical protein
MLRGFHGRMAPIVFAHHGTLDKYSCPYDRCTRRWRSSRAPRPGGPPIRWSAAGGPPALPGPATARRLGRQTFAPTVFEHPPLRPS